MDRIFYNMKAAHDFLINQIQHYLPDFLDYEDIEESFNEFVNITTGSTYEFDEVRGTLGIYFEPLDIKLVYCNHCIPSTNN